MLEIRNLTKTFEKTDALGRVVNSINACRNVNLTIHRGETLGLVGESGSGKSTLGKIILGLDDATEGEILLNGERIDSSRHKNRTFINTMQIIFQDPYSSTNPRRSALSIVAEPLEMLMSKKEAYVKAEMILNKVGINGEDIYKLPREYSGGQRQRIGIARAIATQPDFIVCDEPVSALDVSIQANIINLLMDLQEEEELTYLFITHDLSVVKYIADRIAVMCKGKIVELGCTKDIFERPVHAYTQTLLKAIPIPDPRMKEKQPFEVVNNSSYLLDGTWTEVHEGHFALMED